ncbi:MAG: type II secretion system protein [Fusobacteriaceae bacterium]
MKKREGFTLIELVVVMGIIGVLSSIAVPRLQSSLRRAKDTKALSTLSLLRTASNLYYSEQGEKLGKDGESLGETHINLLVEKEYFGNEIKKMFTETGYKIPVGTVQVCTGDGEGNEKTDIEDLEVVFLSDGISLEFKGENYMDTNCKLWSDL